MAIIPETSSTPLRHGGDLTEARRQFPNAPEPLIDLSTGINPRPYPVAQLSSELFARLPQSVELDALIVAAAKFYAAPSPDHVVAAAGTQILLPLVASLIAPGRAAILGPTYAEHARVAALIGHNVKQVHEVRELANANLAIVVNPNNPDGHLCSRNGLLAVASELQSRGGLLVLDEAFVDVAPDGSSLAPEVDRGHIVVLRSFGKFFGLAGLRLGFALAAPELIARLAAWLGPWAVSGPAIAIGRLALNDFAWAQAARASLQHDAQPHYSTAWEIAASGCAASSSSRAGCASACRTARTLGRASPLPSQRFRNKHLPHNRAQAGVILPLRLGRPVAALVRVPPLPRHRLVRAR